MFDRPVFPIVFLALALAPPLAVPTTAQSQTPASSETRKPTQTMRTSAALPRNQKLVERLRTMLPVGTDMTTASSGFRNQGQFVAAIHVSNNLGIPFDDLKKRMVTD